MVKLILLVLSLLLSGSAADTEKSASAGYGKLFEAGGSGWDPNGLPPPQGDDAGPMTDVGHGWDPDGLK